MNWMTVVKAVAGGVLGLFLGTIAGYWAVAQVYLHRYPQPPDGRAVGFDVRVFLHSVLFWFLVLVGTVGMGFLATRIGHQVS